MKCFERLVMAHINTIIPENLDPHQFAYRPNRSTDDAIYIALYTALSHLDKRNTYVRMLFIDYSSAFNTTVPSKLITKRRILGLNTSLCNWILDFLTGYPQVVRVGSNTSAMLTLNTGTLKTLSRPTLLAQCFSLNSSCPYTRGGSHYPQRAKPSRINQRRDVAKCIIMEMPLWTWSKVVH
jgi:hypothetical protein